MVGEEVVGTGEIFHILVAVILVLLCTQ